MTSKPTYAEIEDAEYHDRCLRCGGPIAATAWMKPPGTRFDGHCVNCAMVM